MMRRALYVALAAVVAGMGSGCATVSSGYAGAGVPMDSCQNLPPAQRPATTCTDVPEARLAGAGIAYFLPRQLARVTATRSVSKVDDAIKAVVRAQAELETARAAVIAATAAIRGTENAIIAASGGDAARPILAQRLSDQKAALATATHAVTVKEGALSTANGKLTNAVTEARGAGPGASKVVLKIELLPPSADPRQAFRVSPHHSAFRDDEHKLIISPAGLLTSTDTIAVDRTADILVEIGTFAGAISAGPIPGGVSRTGRRLQERDPENDRCRLSPNEFAGTVDFTDASEVAVLNRDLQCLGVRLSVVGDVWPERTRPAPTTATGEVEGIVYRTPVEVQVRIERCVREDAQCEAGSVHWFTTETLALALPQAGPISYVRQDAGFMTRSRYTLAFKDGMLINYDASRPSEILEFARTPMRVITGVFGGVSQVLSLRTAQNNAVAALTASEMSALNADFALRTAEIAGETGLTNAQQAALNAEYALRIAQLNGEAGVTAAQMAALNAEFALKAAQITGQTSLTAAQLQALNANFALQTGQLSGQTGITNAQLAFLQSQLGLAAGINDAATQLQERREELSRCVAEQIRLNQTVDPCLPN